MSEYAIPADETPSGYCPDCQTKLRTIRTHGESATHSRKTCPNCEYGYVKGHGHDRNLHMPETRLTPHYHPTKTCPECLSSNVVTRVVDAKESPHSERRAGVFYHCADCGASAHKETDDRNWLVRD